MHYYDGVSNASTKFRSPRFGRERLQSGLSIPRHRHKLGYIAVVLSGGYQEAGLAGRFNLKAGDVVVHRAFDTHLNRVCGRGAQVLNLPLPAGRAFSSVFTVNDPEAIARTAELDPHGAARELTPSGQVTAADDWPDHLASAMVNGPERRLSLWANANGFAPETLSRVFRRVYGITPARFRTEAKAYRALTLIDESDDPLAEIAAECGFADQPHLTRAVVQLTGLPPGYWRRRSILFKTGGI
jgi:AraC-like DNA-binding protein